MPLKAPAPAKPRVDPGPKPSKKLKAFFWDVLPESRVPGTFWAANGPAYTNINTQEVRTPLPSWCLSLSVPSRVACNSVATVCTDTLCPGWAKGAMVR